MNDVFYEIGIGIGIVLGLLGLVAFLWPYGPGNTKTWTVPPSESC